MYVFDLAQALPRSCVVACTLTLGLLAPLSGIVRPFEGRYCFERFVHDQLPRPLGQGHRYVLSDTSLPVLISSDACHHASHHNATFALQTRTLALKMA